MAGAIIPDDWDGFTFECQRIEWPASSQWQAILLGQVSGPSAASYWDENTGDVDDTIVAVDDAFALTVPAIYTESCDDVPELVTAFKVEINTPFVVPPFAFVKIPWADYFYQHNNPGFDFSSSGHRADIVDKLGVWHYDVQIAFTPGTPMQYAVRAWIPEIGLQLARFDNDRPFCTLGFDWVWTVSGYQIEIQVFAASGASVATANGNTFFSGHYVGPVTG